MWEIEVRMRITEKEWERLANSIEYSVKVLLEDQKGISPIKKVRLSERIKMVFEEAYEEMCDI